MSTEQKSSRHFNWLDQAIIQIQEMLTAVTPPAAPSQPNPAADLPEPKLSEAERRESERLMRVNHCGEVCAQALYQGQLAVARTEKTKQLLQKASSEEMNHLSWTRKRIEELGGHRSYLNPFWYANSFFIGAVAGLAGDAWSLGFVEETERQVTKHLENHLTKLSAADMKSRKIIEKMRDDEMQHGQAASHAGAKALPSPIKKLMSLQAKVMTTLSYWI